jgi:hypothetical protein
MKGVISRHQSPCHPTLYSLNNWRRPYVATWSMWGTACRTQTGRASTSKSSGYPIRMLNVSYSSCMLHGHGVFVFTYDGQWIAPFSRDEHFRIVCKAKLIILACLWLAFNEFIVLSGRRRRMWTAPHLFLRFWQGEGVQHTWASRNDQHRVVCFSSKSVQQWHMVRLSATGSSKERESSILDLVLM